MQKSIQKAEAVAREFYNRHNFSIPFEIPKALQILNVSIMFDSKLEKLAAMTFTNDFGQKLIVVNTNYPEDQQRFSICHEISHILLGHKGDFRFTTQITKKTLDEQCADACASELLIPGQALSVLAPRYNFDIQALKEIFRVSEKAMVVKMKILGLPYQNTMYE